MVAKKKPTRPKQKIGSDLGRFDAISDEDIDHEDAPQPDLSDWVRHAQPERLGIPAFQGREE